MNSLICHRYRTTIRTHVIIPCESPTPNICCRSIGSWLNTDNAKSSPDIVGLIIDKPESSLLGSVLGDDVNTFLRVYALADRYGICIMAIQ